MGVRVVVAVALVLGVQSDGGGRRGGVVGRRRGEVTGGTGETAALATRWRTVSVSDRCMAALLVVVGVGVRGRPATVGQLPRPHWWRGGGGQGHRGEIQH